MDADKTSCVFSLPLAHHPVVGKDKKKHQISGYKDGQGDVTPGILKLQ